MLPHAKWNLALKLVGVGPWTLSDATTWCNRSVHQRPTHQTSSRNCSVHQRWAPGSITGWPYPDDSLCHNHIHKNTTPPLISFLSVCLNRSRIWFIFRLCFPLVAGTAGLRVPLCHIAVPNRPPSLASTATAWQLPKGLLPSVNFLSSRSFNKGKKSSAASKLTSPLEQSSGHCRIPAAAPPTRPGPSGPSCRPDVPSSLPTHQERSWLPPALMARVFGRGMDWDSHPLTWWQVTARHLLEALRPPGTGLPSHPVPNPSSCSWGISKSLQWVSAAFADNAEALCTAGSRAGTMMLRQMEKTQWMDSLKCKKTRRIQSCHPNVTCSSGAQMT